MNRALLILIMIFGFTAAAFADEPPRLPLQVDGPVQISPWRAAAQSAAANSPQLNHYLYTTQPPINPAIFLDPGFFFHRHFGRGYYRPAPVTIIQQNIIIRR